MPECDYCGAAHDTEDAHLSHLADEHYEELGPIDKRRVDDATGGSGIPYGPIAIGVVLLAAAGIVGYVVFVAGGSGSNVGQVGTAHYHGQMEMVVLGDRVDFSQSRFQVRDDRFHFEGGNGQQWHAHATGVTFKYAMTSLGFRVDNGPKSITIGEDTYTDGEGYEVVFEINGDSVSNLNYVLKEGDNIRVVVREAN